MDYSILQTAFQQQFGYEGERMFFAPGRINLIGEHTDYNGGHVFPCAITFGTYALVKKRTDKEFHLYSINFPDEGVKVFQLDDLAYNKEHGWANYPKGIVRYLLEEGYEISAGLDIVFYGNIPNGAGLSSSASIELLTGVILEGMFALEIERLQLVKIGKRVENEFIGVNSGIMDQFAVGMGKEHHAMLLDCQTLAYEYAPIQLAEHSIVIMNTNKRRELVDSKYNERRAECDEALEQLQSVVTIKALGELSEEAFEQYSSIITSEVVKKRAKHAVYENQRTLKAFHELQSGNLSAFGELMNASHHSLRDDYEVTGLELDTLVEAAWEQPGVIGARMTGAGFGGCAIAIVEQDQVESFIATVGTRYKENIGYEAAFYVASIGDGAKELLLEQVQ